MYLWFEEEGPAEFPPGLHHFGRFYEGAAIDAGLSPPGSADLVSITASEQLEVNRSAFAFYVPIGFGSHLELIQELCRSDRPLYLAINGIGERGLENLYAVLGDHHFVLTLDARGLSRREFLKQLVWLNFHIERFAIDSGEIDLISMAVTTRAMSLLLRSGFSSEQIHTLQQLLELRNSEMPRPHSREEAEIVVEAQVSLSVMVPRAAGEVLKNEHLTILRAPRPGLAPYLRNAVAGKRLRYPIQPGEALTFGHLLP